MDGDRFDVVTVADRTTLWLDSRRIADCLAYYKDGAIDSVGVNPVRGYALDNLDFLKQNAFIKDLTVVFPASQAFDLEPVLALTSLRSLTVSGPVPLSLRQFHHLEVFRGGWDPALDLSGCDQLQVLELAGYKPRSRDLTQLPALPALRELALVQALITSTDGLRAFPELAKFGLAYNSKLELLSDLEKVPRLAVLDCKTCRRIQRHDRVRVLKRLKVLRFNDCGKIPTLTFLNDLPYLEEFRFVDTEVLDGDLRPLMRLKRVGFLPKKNYSHTPAELIAILEARETQAGLR